MTTPPAIPDFPSPASKPGDIDLEIQIIRGQLDAIQQQLTWLVTTVHGLMSVAQSNPMMRMMMNRKQT